MEDDKQKRLKALQSLASEPQPMQEDTAMPVSADENYFSKLRALKDKRMESANESNEESYRDMVDDSEEASDMSEEGLSQEQKEKIAADTLERKRKELGISDSEESREAKLALQKRNR
jgi:hypothetical protein